MVAPAEKREVVKTAGPSPTLVDGQRMTTGHGLRQAAPLFVGPPSRLGVSISIGTLAKEVGAASGVVENIPPKVAESLKKGGVDVTETGVRL